MAINIRSSEDEYKKLKKGKESSKEEKDEKPIGAPETVSTGNYTPEPMNLPVVNTEPPANFPAPFRLRA